MKDVHCDPKNLIPFVIHESEKDLYDEETLKKAIIIKDGETWHFEIL